MRKHADPAPKPNQWIEARLKELGKSKTSLAKHAFGSRLAAVSELLAGNRKVSLDESRRLADFLQIPREQVDRDLVRHGFKTIAGGRPAGPDTPQAKLARLAPSLPLKTALAVLALLSQLESEPAVIENERPFSSGT